MTFAAKQQLFLMVREQNLKDQTKNFAKRPVPSEIIKGTRFEYPGKSTHSGLNNTSMAYQLFKVLKFSF